MRITSLFLLLVAACGSDPQPTLDSASGTIGPAGGSIVTPEGAAIDVPPGALSSNQVITLTETDQALPTGDWTASSKLYLCTPEGLVFSSPVRMRLPVGTAPEGSTIFWSRLGAPGYTDLGATRSGNYLEATITHFSTGFIAKPTDCFVGTCQTCQDDSRCATDCTGCTYEGSTWSGCVCSAPCVPCTP